MARKVLPEKDPNAYAADDTSRRLSFGEMMYAKRPEFACAECHKSFKTQRALDAHNKTKHPAPKLECYQCEALVDYLFEDSRCKDCTRLTPEEVLGNV